MIHVNLISLDMIGMMLDDLNREFHYKVNEGEPEPNRDMDYLICMTQGKVHIIHFLGQEIWNSAVSDMIEKPTIEEQLEKNTRENFEIYIRLCIQDSIDRFQNINMS